MTSVAGSTVRKSNKTNRDAIGAAGDFRTWQRDALLRLAEKASQAAIEARDLYFKVAHAPELEQDSMQPIAQKGRIVGAKAAALRMMGAHDAA